MSRHIIRLIVVYISCTQVLHFQKTRGLAAADAATAREFRYSMVADTSVGLVNPVMTWSGMSLVQCATACSWEPTCANFLWNSLGGECTIGRSMEKDLGMMGNNSTKLYRVLKTCPYDLGYEIRTDNTKTTQRCLFYAGNPATLAQAKLICGSHGGRIVKTNTWLMMKMTGDMVLEKSLEQGYSGLPTNVLVGADDVASEGNFVWSDGTAVTTNEIQLLFSPGEPNNSGGDEDCVVLHAYKNSGWALNDDRCSHTFVYVCEIEYDYI